MNGPEERKSAAKSSHPTQDRRGTGALDSQRPAEQFRYRDALKLPRLAGLELPAAVSSGVFVEPPGTTRTFARGAPEFYSDPDRTGLFSGFKPDSIASPPAFIAIARHARIVGFRTVLTNDGFFFNDDSIDGLEAKRRFLQDLAMPDPLNEETGLQLVRPPDVFALTLGDRPVQRFEGTTVLLSSAEPANYGSWLFRVLPKLQSLRRCGLPEPVRYLVWAEVPTFQQYLELFGIADDQLIHHDPKNVVYELEHVIVPAMRNNQAFLDAESLAFYSQMRSELGGPMQQGKKIYVSRILQSQGGSSRAMQNEPELITQLLAKGFLIVHPEELSVKDQVAVFSSAELVVGPSGSGMFNVVFCHPGTKIVDIESEPHWIHAHRSLFASCGLRFGIFAGAALDRVFDSHHKPWTVNIEALLARIEIFSKA